MEKYILSDTEQKLYDYIKEKREVTFVDVKKDLGENYLGASGRLTQRDLVEIGRKRVVISAFPKFKYVKTLKIKEV